MEERLSATYLLDRTDPTRLAWNEIEAGWGSCFNFFLSYGLKPWNQNDGLEALQISRHIKSYRLDEDLDAEMAAMELLQAEEEKEVKKKQQKDKKIKKAFTPSELDIQFADQVYNYIKSRKAASINYNEVVENIPYKGNARGIDVIRNDPRLIESFTKISLRVTPTNEAVNRTTPAAVATPAPAPVKKVAAAGGNKKNSDTEFADKVFAFLKSKRIRSINYNQIIAKIPYNGARRGIDVIREDPRFTEITSNVSLSKKSAKKTKVRDFTREWETVLSNWRRYDILQLLAFVRTLELCDSNSFPSRKPKIIPVQSENMDERDDVSVSSISSLSSVASSTGSTMSLRTQDSSDASAASNPFFHLVNESDSDDEEEEDKAVSSGNVAAEVVAPTQSRYLLVRLKCAIAEMYRNLAVKAQKEQQLPECSKNWVEAYSMLTGCFGDVEIWSFLLTNFSNNLPEQHDKSTLQMLCDSFRVLAEDTDREKKKSLDLLDKKKQVIMGKLDPMLAQRDAVKQSWGKRWTQNPHPKMDYAEKRKQWEQQLRDVNNAITIIAPLRIVSTRSNNPAEQSK